MQSLKVFDKEESTVLLLDVVFILIFATVVIAVAN